MAVYTQISELEMAAFLADYELGELNEMKPIIGGVSNSNYLLLIRHPEGAQRLKDFQRVAQDPSLPLRFRSVSVQDDGRYIFTIFENINSQELPFFIGLTEHLNKKSIKCPRPIHDRAGKVIQEIKDKPAILVEFLEGQESKETTKEQIKKIGELVAKLHLAVADFLPSRENPYSLTKIEKIFQKMQGLKEQENIEKEFLFLKENMPNGLPAGIIHADIFPDNVFFKGEEVSGIIDFYLACTGFFAYDLAIAINAWCFDAQHNFLPEFAQILLGAYQKIRILSKEEKENFVILARLAALRFLITRLYAEKNIYAGAVVSNKNPEEYAKKLEFWQNYFPCTVLLET